MKLLFSDITEDGFFLEAEENIEIDAVALPVSVKASLRIDKISYEVLVTGHFAAYTELQCSRCLKLFTKDIDGTINAVFHPVEELKIEDKHEIRDDELNTDFYKENALDVQELLKEHLILSIPMKPLCSETCKGICPVCGADRNTDICSCEQEHTDSRLSILKTLL